MNIPSSRSAFTLVELSIVLVILGLLIGGVLTGQSLIRAAELRSVSTQQQRYVTAVQTFRDKYFAIPGDMTNATAYWGAADGSTGKTTACLGTTSNNATTCNGDGDGFLNVLSYSNERLRFWQHLANAGLIEGSYTGTTAVASGNGPTSANSPTGRLSSSLWYSVNWATQTNNTTLFDGVYNNVLQFGAYIANTDNFNPVMKPEEAYNIDTKMDDGKPATGNIMMRQVNGWTGTNNCTDATASNQFSAQYLLSYTGLACAFEFKQAF